MDLQNTFYILGIICMVIMLVLVIALVVAVFAIRAKINAIHKTIEEKLSIVTNISSAGAGIYQSVKKVIDRTK